MRIKSKIDVITNSSTEVFILKSPETDKDKINNFLQSRGFKGEVSKLTKEIWEKYREEDWKLGYLDSFFPDKKSKNRGYYLLYRDYIFWPKSETPDIFEFDGETYTTYPDLEISGEGKLREKITKELLIPCVEEMKAEMSSPVNNIDEFLRDPIKNFVYCPWNIIEFRYREKFYSWIDNNINLFPDYNLLLNMYEKKDISEFFGDWIDFFEDYEEDNYLGDIDLDYELYRLS